MDKHATSPDLDASGGPRSLTRLLAAGISVLQALGWLTLLLTSLFFVRLLAANPTYIYIQEVAALKSLQAAVQAGPASGAVASKSSALTGVEVGVAGVATVTIPPIVWVIMCVIAAVYFVVLIEKMITVVVRQWVTVWTCNWTNSILSFLGCLWQLTMALVATLVTVLMIVVLVICVLSNVAALIAVF